MSRSLATSSASTRPSASEATGAVSGGSGTACRRIRLWASATLSIADPLAAQDRGERWILAPTPPGGLGRWPPPHPPTPSPTEGRGGARQQRQAAGIAPVLRSAAPRLSPPLPLWERGPGVRGALLLQDRLRPGVAPV